jgi:hypothetical protein
MGFAIRPQTPGETKHRSSGVTGRFKAIGQIAGLRPAASKDLRGRLRDRAAARILFPYAVPFERRRVIDCTLNSSNIELDVVAFPNLWVVYLLRSQVAAKRASFTEKSRSLSLPNFSLHIVRTVATHFSKTIRAYRPLRLRNSWATRPSLTTGSGGKIADDRKVLLPRKTMAALSEAVLMPARRSCCSISPTP